MNIYRTHTCNDLRKANAGETVRLSGWVFSKRDHGNLLFIDLRDHYGRTQCVVDTENKCFEQMTKLRPETVIKVTGKVVERATETINDKLPTGEIEVIVDEVEVLGNADVLPFSLTADESDLSEEQRLTYRFLDLRREKPHANIVLRNRFIQSLRQKMWAQGFMEFQTPILTASSPEGARDYLVPSRVHQGMFYALPQSPQQFKQLLMVSGFDKYFQIAPCFRDEDSRADRSPGEFYQLDMEMSFCEQQDIMDVMEPVVLDAMKEFAPNKDFSAEQFRHIPFAQSMLTYGTDKPDLRNPLVIKDVTETFRDSEFGIFASMVENGAFVRAIKAPECASKPRSWFDKLGAWAKDEGFGGLAYISWAAEGAKGPVANKLSPERVAQIASICDAKTGDVVFFVAGKGENTAKFAGQVRTALGKELGLIDENKFIFCWITDFPFFEENPDTHQIEFSHNPFSMPQGGMEALLNQNPFEIKAYQFDCVCNGYEICSGAIRNHREDIMYKAFEMAGYGKEVVEAKFGGMLKAFRFGAPPHGGCAFGVDRLVMLLCNETYIREVIAFPFNQRAQDLLMQAPSPVSELQLREAHIKIRGTDNK